MLSPTCVPAAAGERAFRTAACALDKDGEGGVAGLGASGDDGDVVGACTSPDASVAGAFAMASVLGIGVAAPGLVAVEEEAVRVPRVCLWCWLLRLRRLARRLWLRFALPCGVPTILSCSVIASRILVLAPSCSLCPRCWPVREMVRVRLVVRAVSVLLPVVEFRLMASRPWACFVVL